MHEHAEYLFRKPLWRKVVPALALALVWSVPLFLVYATAPRESTGLADTLAALAGKSLVEAGITVKRATWIAGFLSFPLVLLFVSGFERLLITPEAITRISLIGTRYSLRWTDIDEVLIEHIEAHLEGKATARKVLTLYAVRRRFVPWRRRMKITNRQFEGYHHVERIASQVSVPAIAARKRAEIQSRKKAARFAERRPTDDLKAVFYAVAGVALLAAWLYEATWREPYAQYRHWVLGVAIFMELLALRKFLFRQLGIDRDNLLVMRRSWVMKKIPLDTITDVRVRDNRMRVYAQLPNWKHPKKVFGTSRYIRNRGVLLRLIREAHEARRIADATPIVPVHSISPEPGAEQPVQIDQSA
jgi:hypothetical protein